MRTVSLFTLTSLLATASVASADIGYTKAISLCRGAVPQGTLLGIEQRERNNVWVYEGDMYDAALTTNWGPRFNRETGASRGIDVDAPDESDLPNLEAIFARLSEAVLQEWHVVRIAIVWDLEVHVIVLDAQVKRVVAWSSFNPF